MTSLMAIEKSPGKKSAPKIAEGSVFTVSDQLNWYEQEMGTEAAQRQVLLRKKERGQCTCEPSKLKKDWMNSGRKTTRTIHATSCAKHRPWMAEAVALSAGGNLWTS